ncbi:MAG: hypothetical protein GC189_02620 [Alphaproteobacteria bacterium]|nr:hypothetical protein [Alphaproteobacteria bacterium]
MEDIFVPLSFFGFLTAVIVVPIWLRERTRQSAHKLISQAIERGQALDPETIERLTTDPTRGRQHDRPRRTLGTGVILMALALALSGSAFFTGDFDPTGHSFGGQMTGAAILAALGLAFLILAVVDYRSKAAERRLEDYTAGQ